MDSGDLVTKYLGRYQCAEMSAVDFVSRVIDDIYIIHVILVCSIARGVTNSMF